VAGIAWALGARTGLDDPGSTFLRLNVAVYTPLCLAMAACALHVARSGLPDRPQRLMNGVSTMRPGSNVPRTSMPTSAPMLTAGGTNPSAMP